MPDALAARREPRSTPARLRRGDLHELAAAADSRKVTSGDQVFVDRFSVTQSVWSLPDQVMDPS